MRSVIRNILNQTHQFRNGLTKINGRGRCAVHAKKFETNPSKPYNNKLCEFAKTGKFKYETIYGLKYNYLYKHEY